MTAAYFNGLSNTTHRVWII